MIIQKIADGTHDGPRDTGAACFYKERKILPAKQAFGRASVRTPGCQRRALGTKEDLVTMDPCFRDPLCSHIHAYYNGVLFSTIFQLADAPLLD